MRWWLFVNRRSRVFELPDGVGRVPKFTFWWRRWLSHVLISLHSMRDSGEVPCGGGVPVPSRHSAFGKLKSPANIISGTGVFKFEMVVLILLIMVFVKDNSRRGP